MKVEVAVPNSPYGLCGREATTKEEKERKERKKKRTTTIFSVRPALVHFSADLYVSLVAASCIVLILSSDFYVSLVAASCIVLILSSDF